MTTSDPTPARDRRREQVRQEILQAAWRLAERDGIARLTLRDLAREVGLRAPSLYTYFASKGEIYDAMFTDGYRQLDACYETFVPDRRDPVGTLTAGVVIFLEFCRACVPRYQLMFTRAVPEWEPSPRAYAVSIASYRRMAELLADVGVAGQRALDLWTALTTGLASQQLANDPTGDRWARLAPTASEMFLHHARRMQ